MYVVNFNTLMGLVEYLGVEDDLIKTVLDPNFAKLFKTKAAANTFMKKNVAWDVEHKVITFAYAIKKWKADAADGVVIRIISNKSPLSRKYDGEGPDEVLKWRIEQYKADESSIDYEDYATWPNLYSVFKHLWGVQGYYSSDYKNKHMTFQVRVAKDSKYGEFKRELAKVLPHVTMKDDDGNPILDVFDHYLSEHGNSVSLVITGKDKAKVVGRYSEHVSGSLRDCFDYMCRERYYE